MGTGKLELSGRDTAGAWQVGIVDQYLLGTGEVGYTDDWYAYDVMSKEIDTVETFNAATYLTRKLETLADRIDRRRMAILMAERNPVKALRYLYDTVVG